MRAAAMAPMAPTRATNIVAAGTEVECFTADLELQSVLSIPHDGRYHAISTALADVSIEMPLKQTRYATSRYGLARIPY